MEPPIDFTLTAERREPASKPADVSDAHKERVPVALVAIKLPFLHMVWVIMKFFVAMFVAVLLLAFLLAMLTGRPEMVQLPLLALFAKMLWP